mgnify:FL=1
MIKKIIYLAFLLPLAGNAQTTVIKPLVKQPTAFAIITCLLYTSDAADD